MKKLRARAWEQEGGREAWSFRTSAASRQSRHPLKLADTASGRPWTQFHSGTSVTPRTGPCPSGCVMLNLWVAASLGIKLKRDLSPAYSTVEGTFSINHNRSYTPLGPTSVDSTNQRSKIFGKNIPQSSKKQNVNLPHDIESTWVKWCVGILLGHLSNLEMT